MLDFLVDFIQTSLLVLIVIQQVGLRRELNRAREPLALTSDDHRDILPFRCGGHDEPPIYPG